MTLALHNDDPRCKHPTNCQVTSIFSKHGICQKCTSIVRLERRRTKLGRTYLNLPKVPAPQELGDR
jgi:hypothetical protein